MSYATRINIDNELAAIAQGQCAGCRVGITHQPDEPCYNFQEYYATMKYCSKCNLLFNAGRFEKCPVCTSNKKRGTP